MNADNHQAPSHTPLATPVEEPNAFVRESSTTGTESVGARHSTNIHQEPAAFVKGPGSPGPGGIGGPRRPDIQSGPRRPDVPQLLPQIAAIEFTADTIAAAIQRLADQLARDFATEPFVLLGVLKGALFFTADLARALPATADVSIDFLAVSSYGNSDRSSGEVRLLKDTSESVEGKNVVIVEDIVDNGLTLQYLQRLFAGRGPASLRSCVLLDKPYRRRVDVPVDYVGLTAPDTFIVGYGLDYQEKYRNLPYLARLHDWAFRE